MLILWELLIVISWEIAHKLYHKNKQQDFNKDKIMVSALKIKKDINNHQN